MKTDYLIAIVVNLVCVNYAKPNSLRFDFHVGFTLKELLRDRKVFVRDFHSNADIVD